MLLALQTTTALLKAFITLQQALRGRSQNHISHSHHQTVTVMQQWILVAIVVLSSQQGGEVVVLGLQDEEGPIRNIPGYWEQGQMKMNMRRK
jgi:hypothetical protein